jgi:hypothetical protein|tara:strand:+ start:540 stop:1106 length:567 start_codon:yes stop_codon:yes gene_type:complete
MMAHVSDANEKPKYRLVQDNCQPAIMGGCFSLGCCYELHYEIHRVEEGDDTKGCCNGFKLQEPVGSVAPVMNTPIQRLIESQTGLAKQRARIVLPADAKEADKLVMLQLIFFGMTNAAQSNVSVCCLYRLRIFYVSLSLPTSPSRTLSFTFFLSLSHTGRQRGRRRTDLSRDGDVKRERERERERERK